MTGKGVPGPLTWCLCWSGGFRWRICGTGPKRVDGLAGAGLASGHQVGVGAEGEPGVVVAEVLAKSTAERNAATAAPSSSRPHGARNCWYRRFGASFLMLQSITHLRRSELVGYAYGFVLSHESRWWS